MEERLEGITCPSTKTEAAEERVTRGVSRFHPGCSRVSAAYHNALVNHDPFQLSPKCHRFD